MGDLIRREALFDAMREKEWQNWPPLDEIDAVIEKAPAVDAVEVVRCKDCKERTQSGGMVLHCSLNGIQTDDDDFCSYGCRMEG